MKSIATIMTDCTMWKKLDRGTILIVPDKVAIKAIKNRWAKKAEHNNLLRGER